MVPASNEQCSRCHAKLILDLRQNKELVECRHQRKKKGGQKEAKNTMDLRRACRSEGPAPEVDSAIPEANVEPLLINSQWSWGLESSAQCQSSGWCDHGSSNRYRRQPSKNNLAEEKDAET
jgi:hypothetical protein